MTSQITDPSANPPTANVNNRFHNPNHNPNLRYLKRFSKSCDLCAGFTAEIPDTVYTICVSFCIKTENTKKRLSATDELSIHSQWYQTLTYPELLFLFLKTQTITMKLWVQKFSTCSKWVEINWIKLFPSFNTQQGWCSTYVDLKRKSLQVKK